MVENIHEIYAALEAESIGKGSKGEKSAKIRAFVSDAVAELKRPKLHLGALFKLAKQELGLVNSDRSQFTTIVKKMYETEQDAGNGTWIIATKPKTQE